MYIKATTLSDELEKLRNREELSFLFNMATELLEQRFLPIKCHDVKLNWVGLLVWDNEKNLLHGPFQVPGSMLGTNEFMDGYKWEDDELYVYFLCKIDYSIRGLRNGKAVFEEV